MHGDDEVSLRLAGIGVAFLLAAGCTVPSAPAVADIPAPAYSVGDYWREGYNQNRTTVTEVFTKVYENESYRVHSERLADRGREYCKYGHVVRYAT